MRLGVDSDDAEDIAQETWMRAIEHRSQFIGRGSFDAWLARISRRIWIDQARAERRHAVRMTRFVANGWVETNHIGTDEEAHFAARERLAAILRQEIGVLPPLQRRVATYRWLLGRSIAETACEIGIAEGTVKACLYQVRVKLRSSPVASAYLRAMIAE